MKKNNLHISIQEFLHDYLILQKNFSRHTILSYRDTIKMFLIFSAKRKNKSVTNLALSDLDSKMVIHFLDHLETNRRNSPQTRNIRLACFHSLFRYLADHDPLISTHCQQILLIPFKRMKSAPVEYLEREEMKAVLDAPDRESPDGYRYYTLFYFMYNTGARVQETIDLTAQALHLERPFYVRFLGKGKKERLCPLWPETVKLLKSLLKKGKLDKKKNTPVFVNHKGDPFTRHGIRYLLNKYVRIASESCHSLKVKHIHPHSIRHATAVSLLQSGIDINTIRAWLGHADIKTTNRYAEINLEMKQQVLSKYLPITKTNKPWKKNYDLLEWLESL